MSNNTIFIAPPGARKKREHIFKELISLCPENDFSSVLYLCPNSFISREAEKNFFHFLKKPAYIPFQGMTLKNLGEKLYSEGHDSRRISERARVLILCEILNEKNTGYARLLSDLYKKIKQYTPDKGLSEVRDEAVSLIFEEKAAGRAKDAIGALILYEEKLREKGLIDAEEMMQMSRSLIKESLNPSTLVIDGFFDPAPLELQIIDALIRNSGNVLLLVEKESGMYKHFKKRGDDLRVMELTSRSRRESTGYFTYPSIEEEAESIARTAKGLVLEGTDPQDIVVTFPDLKKYTPILKRVFNKHGMPLSVEEYDLSSSGPLLALDCLFACMEEDYPAYDLLSVLTSPDLPGISPITKEWAVSYVYRAGIIKGKDSWLSIKETILNSLYKKPADDEIERLNEVQNGIKDVIEMIEDLRKKRTISSFLDSLEAGLKRLGLSESSCPEKRGDIVEMLFARFSELRSFDELYKPVVNNTRPPLFYLRNILKDMKGFTKKGDGVRAIPFELASGIESEVLFFGGATEEEIPSRPVIDPILPEKVKKELGLPFLDHYMSRQKRYFMRALNSSKKEPYFSCPSADGDKLLLPSPLLEWDSVITPARLNIFSEEDLLIMDGAYRGLTSGEEGLMRQNAAGSGLHQRIASITKGPVSVTDIDSYRRCPLRFYIEKILDINIEEPPKFEVEARLWGTLAHKVMENLFKAGDVEIEKIDMKLFEGLEAALAKFPIGSFWSNVAHEIFQRLMPLIKAQEKAIRAEGFAPHEVEKKIKSEVNGLSLKGKIDRVDIKGSTAILLDYKTGNPDKESLQLPLYASMWQKEFSGTVEKVGVYSLKEGKITWYPSKGSMDEYMEEALIKAAEVVENIRKGIFLPEPHSTQECRYCYHSPLCDGAKN